MAIFRQGIRVGPFDLRLGLSRDKSLQNVDKDPRLRQYANTENQMGRFRAAMAAANGYARATRFAVRIFPPTNLENQVKAAEVADTRAGGNFEAANSGKQMSDITVALGRQLNIHCDSISMPAHDLQAETVTTFGPSREMVTGHGFTGTIGASFYADSFLRERHFLEMWQKMAVNHTTHKAGYYKDYIGRMQIFQLASDNVQDHPSYGIEATEVYPETISAIDYSYGSTNQLVKINVGFAYKQWYNLTTDHISGMTFGNSMQTIHDQKSPDTGLFGRLPIELQRAGRDVFNSAKNQIPIGRLFKGKLFPPFT